MANNANTFMVGFINSDEKFIVGYELTDGTLQGACMAEKVKEIIRKCKKAGVTIVSHSQDMGSSNIST